MAGYVYFTDEQKQRANSVDLVYFLQSQGEMLLPSGREKRLQSDHSITVRGSRWYDHAAEEGGYAIDLVKRLYHLPFPDAVSLLLGGEQGADYKQYHHREEQRKPFKLPEAHTDMRRVYAYLMKQRMIDRNVIYEFGKEKLLYEDSAYHNMVFVGVDEQGVPRHAHKKSTSTIGAGYRGNVEGSNPEYSFHYISKNPGANKLFVFEAPIDMLSYISMNQKSWNDHHYVALNGVSEKSILKLLELYPQINHVILGLDHDPAGMEADEKIYDLLIEKGVQAVERVRSVYKDWNEDLKEKNGITAIPAETHPQHILRDVLSHDLNERLKELSNCRCSLASLQQQYDGCKQMMDLDEYEHAKVCLKDLTALSVLAIAKESPEGDATQELWKEQSRLNHGFRAYQNRGTFEHKVSDIRNCLESLFLLQKKELPMREKLEELAAECFKATILAECRQPVQSQSELMKPENGLMIS